MKKLYVLYDAKCGLCKSCRIWLGRQPAYVPLVFIPLQSPDLEERFPGVSALQPEEQILIIADTGEVWRGVDGWIMCLWALREYRAWSLRLVNPLLRPFARRVCEWAATNRHSISGWFFRTPAKAAVRMLQSGLSDEKESASCSL